MTPSRLSELGCRTVGARSELKTCTHSRIETRSGARWSRADSPSCQCLWRSSLLTLLLLAYRVFAVSFLWWVLPLLSNVNQCWQ